MTNCWSGWNPQIIPVGKTETTNCGVDTGSGADLLCEQFILENKITYLNRGKYKGPHIEAVSGEELQVKKVVTVAMELGGRGLMQHF